MKSSYRQFDTLVPLHLLLKSRWQLSVIGAREKYGKDLLQPRSTERNIFVPTSAKWIGD